MVTRVMIVEDEMLVACHLESIVEDLGYEPVGIAADAAEARALCGAKPDIALVDINLRDGPTGPAIGGWLGREGVSVVFITANPALLGQGVANTLGVVSKPCDDACLHETLVYARDRREGRPATPPAVLTAF
ncbi:MAG: response regulator [Caulobacteraceae bacterium]|nr:response regulator [Caulobacter sp.]